MRFGANKFESEMNARDEAHIVLHGSGHLRIDMSLRAGHRDRVVCVVKASSDHEPILHNLCIATGGNKIPFVDLVEAE